MVLLLKLNLFGSTFTWEIFVPRSLQSEMRESLISITVISGESRLLIFIAVLVCREFRLYSSQFVISSGKRS